MTLMTGVLYSRVRFPAASGEYMFAASPAGKAMAGVVERYRLVAV